MFGFSLQLSRLLFFIIPCNNQHVSCCTSVLVNVGGIKCHQDVLSTLNGSNE